MKISKIEYISIIVFVAILGFGGGWFLRGSSTSAPVEIETQYVVASAVAVTTEEPTTTTAIQGVATATPVEEPLMVNINTATVDELDKLPNIGEQRAQDIVAYREENGPFDIPEALTEVPGIGEGILAQIIDYITVE